MGVFATRSPYRPNPIGLTSVEIVQIGEGEIIVKGADLMDGTPIFDIKPYLSFSDAHPDARNGFAEQTKDYALEIQNETQITIPSDVMEDIYYILKQDPRPAYQNDPKREYKLDYAGYRVVFVVENAKIIIKQICSNINCE